jgi:hypothetical protein
MQDDEALCLNAMVFGNVARFLNHRCEDANLLDMFMWIEEHNPHYYHVRICLPLHTLEFFSNSPIDLWLSQLIT